MRLFNKIAIVGTGLIGGSIALAVKKNKLADKIVGVSRHKESLLIARKKGVIDSGSCDLSIIKGAQLVVLAAPVEAIIKLAPKIAAIIGRDSIVTDVGSTKGEIVLCLEKLFPNYVGSHPLAGSEKRGVINARPDLFKDSLCILTPTRNTNNKALKKLECLWRCLGARTALLSPAAHDKVLSFVSHLPHIAAFSLANIMPRQYLKFASTGLKDTTRIAASESELWVDILLSNRKNIIKTVELLQADIGRIKTVLQKKDRRSLTLIIRQARFKRELLG